MNFFAYFVFVIFSIVKASNKSNNSDTKPITNHPFDSEVEKTTPEDLNKNNTTNIDVVNYSFSTKQQVFWFIAICSIAFLIIVGVYGYMTSMS